MTRLLVLGGTGMLGGAVSRVLAARQEWQVITSCRSVEHAGPIPSGTRVALDVEDCTDDALERAISGVRPNVIINCIGVINRYCRDDDAQGVRRAVRVNAMFPHQLAAVVSRLKEPVNVISIATDCVYSGRVGHYDEACVHDPVDFYGKSKSLGEVQADFWLNIRCSIIGPEPIRRASLLEWFRAHPPGAKVLGYTDHLWNGVTTVQFARLCEHLVLSNCFEKYRHLNHTLHYVPNEPVSKYELLCMLNQSLGAGLDVEPTTAPGGRVDRTLASRYLHGLPTPMRLAVEHLAEDMRTGILAEM